MMEQSNRKRNLLLFLTVIWLGYAIWELAIWFWAAKNDISGPIVRVDFYLIIPFLVITSLIVLYLLYKNAKQNK